MISDSVLGHAKSVYSMSLPVLWKLDSTLSVCMCAASGEVKVCLIKSIFAQL